MPQMAFNSFREKAKQTGFRFNSFIPANEFLNCHVAELKSHRYYVGLYSNNNMGGITLVVGWSDNPEQQILFFDNIESVKAEEITDNIHQRS